ncbi:MAG: prepilin-type N-terminal cleavage/methylation domain-containing protein [Candidatus Acidiferrales bacterium]
MDFKTQGETMNKKQKGFSLIELLIVVAIILIIAAIAIPNLLRSRMAANEASAVGTVRTVVTSEVTYASTWGQGFAAAVTNLGGAVPCVTPTAAAACLLDSAISVAPNQKSGYTITATGGGGAGTASSPNTQFETAAVPMKVGTTGQRTFCSDESGVVRFDVAGGADPATDVKCEALPALQ